ncbi:MAG: dTDP-4-dehydrorhamnose reductase [Methylococcaceae bacterium]
MPEIKTILVTGSNGQLGLSLKSLVLDYPQYQFTFIGRDELDLSNTENITYYFKQKQFDLIINCAAYTAVDQAEQQQELADRINHLAVKQLAKVAQDNNSVLIHISTDYVFDGTSYKPYSENDQTNPQSVYGTSKLKGELAIQSISPKAIIIRTAWVYSEFGSNFVKTMIKLGLERENLNVIFDQIGSPTYAKDLADSILKMIGSASFQKNTKGQLYHYSNEGVCSWYDFAKTIFELSNISTKVTSIETKDYSTPAKRPHYSVLNKAKIKQDFDLTIPYWKDSLQACLATLQQSKVT